MLRRILIALLLAASSCSFGITSVDPDWDGTDEPKCDDAYGAVVLDSLVAGVSLGVASAAIEAESDTVVVGSSIVALAFAVSAGIGGQAVRECKEAKAQWRIGGAIGRASRSRGKERKLTDDEIERAGEAKAARKESAKIERDRQLAALAAAKSAPRGFYCSASVATPLSGLCTRQKADCERARDAAVAAVADLSACALTEKAWCFDAGSGNDDERCAPAQDGCVAMQARAAATGAVGACAEVE